MLKRKAHPVYLAASLFCATSFAQPFDLDYRVSGYESLRPKLIFNDGNDTFIQGDESLRAIGVPYERQGPYLVIKGIRERIVLEGRGMRKVSIIYTGSAITPAMLTQQTEDSKARCDQAAVESRRVELMYGPENTAPGPLLRKTLQQQIPEINRSAFTQIFIGSDGGILADKRASNLRDFLLKKNVPAVKFSVKVVEDQSGQAYMLISNATSCEPLKSAQTPPPPLFANTSRGETTYAPPTKKGGGAGDVNTVLQLLNESKISEETASTMIASINLSQRGTKLERLYAKNNVTDLQKTPATTSRSTVDVIAAKEPDMVVKSIIGQFTVENEASLEIQAKGAAAAFPVDDFAKKPTAKIMARLAGIVGEKRQSLFIVKGDGSPEAKSASANAAKSLLRLGVENVRFDRGASAGRIEILEEGERK